MSDFYSSEEEKDIPSTSNYMKFLEGDNKFRILGSFKEGTTIRGVVYWTTVDGKRMPKRLPVGAIVPVEELELNKFGEVDRPRFFWAFPVWNYQEKKVQILEVTQTSVLNFIKKQIDNPKWGDPREYDFTVTRDDSSGKTVYTMTNDPKEEIDPAILKQYGATRLNMKALFSGDDPFGEVEEQNTSTGGVEVAEVPEDIHE